ncbi:MAG: hypothetical protein WC661_20180 [Opitutaceae bacterium]|jgi:hypothetical protein
MKTLVLLIIALAGTIAAGAEPQKLPLPPHPTSFDLAEAGNRFIALGEEDAVGALMLLCKDSKNEYGVDIDSKTREQIGWMCRLLFTPKAGATLRPPGFGGLSLPNNTMNRSDWPFYPLAESDGVFFVLADGYFLAGVAEDPRKYIRYCQSEGKFRSEPLVVPTEETAAKALDALLRSEIWKKIKWTDSKWYPGGGGFSYTMNEENIVTYLKRQTRKTPASSPIP